MGGERMARTASARTLDPESAQLCLAALDIGLCVVGRGGDVRYLNPTVQELFEVRSEEILGAPVSELLGLAHDGPLGPEGEVWRRCVLPPTQILTQRGEKELALECRIVPLGRKSRPDGGLLLIEDISESAEEQAFQRNIDRFSSMGSISAVFAHEIRNPLTGIRTTIQFVETKLPDDSALRGDLDDAIKELDRIEQFTTDLLQFARPKISALEPANLNDLIEKVLGNVSARCEEQQVQLKRELTEELPEIPLDADAVQQALLNIIINALDAMPTGGTLRVSSSTRRYRTRRAVEVAVADTGTGISEEHMEKIFDPFFTTRGAGGTGLGLSIALQVAKEHNGRIYVRNRPQGGAIFRLSFRVPDESEGNGS
ncbi:MAG: PAS domain-containing protein [Candidatus Eisenbacteria bacterium]|nr:PAS domain-containing protein [Candidatus Eisenbacteria bacterium]